jgi:lipopolysaccharide export system permease protein
MSELPRAKLPRVRILTRYLVARFLGFFAAFLIVAIVTIAIVEMMLNLGDMLRGDDGLSGISSYLLLRLPAYYLRDLVPMVAFGAAFFTLATAARWLELLAMKAGGLSPRRIAAPLLGAAIVLSGATFVVNETLILEATRLWNQRDVESNPIRFRQGSFWYQRGRTIYNIGDADRATNTLRGVRIFELDSKGRLLRSIDAPSATVDPDDRWHFQSPLIRSFDAADRAAPPVVERHAVEVSLALQDAGGLALMNADLGTLSVDELSQVIAQQRSHGRQATRPRALFHRRLAEPFVVLLFVLAAIPLGVGARARGSQGTTLPALYGVLIVAAFFSLRSAANTLTTGGLLPPSPTPWILLLVFGLFATWRYVEMPG